MPDRNTAPDTNHTRLFYDSHMHTPMCKHARGEPEAYAQTGHARGLKGIIITDHCPLPDNHWSGVRMSPEEFDDYLALVARTRAAWADKLDVRLGMESDYIPGLHEDWLAELHARADFDYILGSVHPQNSEYQQRYLHNGDVRAFQRAYFEHLAQAAETGLFDALAHPDLVKIMFPMQWDVEALRDDIRRSLDRIAAAGTAMELNTSGVNKTYPEMNPGPAILAEMHARAIPVVVGSDAHEPARVGADFPRALDLLAEAGYREVSVFLGRERHAIPLADARASLA